VIVAEPLVTVPPGVDPPLWMQNATYPAIVDRDLVDALWTGAGVLGVGDLAVAPRGAGANMSVDVAAGRAIVAGSDAAGQGKYLCRATSTVNLPVAVAPGPGLSRIDLVVAHVYDDAVIGGSDHAWIPEIVAGTAAASPVAPPTPNSALVLAQLTIPNGLAAVAAGNIADARVRAAVNRPWHLPWGILASVSNAADVANNNNVETTVCTLGALTFRAGRAYEIRAACSISASATTVRSMARLFNQTDNARVNLIDTGGGSSNTAFCRVEASYTLRPTADVTKTFALTMQNAAGTGTVTVSGTDPQKAVLSVVDLGPNVLPGVFPALLPGIDDGGLVEGEPVPGGDSPPE
jgi:hypothetical protein